jgi:hypothetical protein
MRITFVGLLAVLGLFALVFLILLTNSRRVPRPAPGTDL